MKKSIFFTIILCLLIGKPIFACGPEWTYIGSDYGVPNCIYQLPDSEEVFLRGIPGMGVYRWVQDTTWDCISLSGQGVTYIHSFPWLPGQLFAQIGCGDLSRSFDNGFSWHQIRISETGNQFEYTDFLVDPLDTTKWIQACHTPTMADYFFVSTNAGANWEQVVLPGVCYHFMWFEQTPEVIYSGRRGTLNSINLTDYTKQNLAGMSNGRLCSVIRHPSQPWIYVLGEGIGVPGVLLRYDIPTGNIVTRILQDTISVFYNNHTYLKYSENHGVLVGGKNNVLLVDDDLQSVQVFEPPVPEAWSTQILFASSDLWIVEAAGYGIFCLDPNTNAVHDHPLAITSHFAYYPNPARESISFVSSNQKIGRVEIYNLLGQRVQDWSGTSTNTPILLPLASLSSGTYFFRIYESPTDVNPIQRNTFNIIK
jgi:hypothetical protein